MTLERQIFDFAEWLLLAVLLWWIVGAGLWIGALRADRPSLRRAATVIGLPGSQRIAQALLAAGLIALPSCSTEQRSPTLVYLGESATGTSVTTGAPPPTSTTLPPTTLPPTTLPPTTLPPTQAEVVPLATDKPSTGTARHEVVAGDHLWGIAARRLADTGRPVTNAEIADYWRKLITTNAGTIRSGDPNLIFPGEILTLPPLV